MEYWERMDRRKAYLLTVKAGDTVAIMSGGSYTTVNDAKVRKVTATQIVVEGHTPSFPRRFKIDGGKEIGEGKSYYTAELIDPEWASEHRASREAERNFNRLVHKLVDTRWSRFDAAQLQRIVDVVTAVETESEEQRAKEAF